jgi:hypothetical protein
MSFAFGGRELRRGILSMLETHIVMSSLISRLALILMVCLAFTLVLRLALFHVLRLNLLMDLIIAHMVLVHERIALSLDASSLIPLSHKKYVTFGDDKKGKVLGTGIIKVNDCFTLNDVALVDRLRYNLLSIS